MGFACNALAYGVIRRAGSLTLKVLGTVKNVAVVGAGIAVFGDKVGLLQAAGYAVSIGGFVSYQRVKAGSGGGSGSGSASSSSEKEAAEAANGGISSKIEAVSSFIPASAKAAALSPALAPEEASGSEKRPLLPASFVPTLSAHDSTSSLSASSSSLLPASVSSASAADSSPLSTVDAIAAKLSGFFSFGATTAPATTTSEIAAGRV